MRQERADGRVQYSCSPATLCRQRCRCSTSSAHGAARDRLPDPALPTGPAGARPSASGFRRRRGRARGPGGSPAAGGACAGAWPRRGRGCRSVPAPRAGSGVAGRDRGNGPARHARPRAPSGSCPGRAAPGPAAARDSAPGAVAAALPGPAPGGGSAADSPRAAAGSEGGREVDRQAGRQAGRQSPPRLAGPRTPPGLSAALGDTGARPAASVTPRAGPRSLPESPARFGVPARPSADTALPRHRGLSGYQELRGGDGKGSFGSAAGASCSLRKCSFTFHSLSTVCL